MTRFKMVFTSLNTFPLVLEKRCEICRADSHVYVDMVWDMLLTERSHKKHGFTSLFDDIIHVPVTDDDNIVQE